MDVAVADGCQRNSCIYATYGNMLIKISKQTMKTQDLAERLKFEILLLV